MTRFFCLLSALALVGLTSCVTQGFPNHGGGKRFFVEQHLVSRSAEVALNDVDWSQVPKAGPVRVYVIAMGDEGGGLTPQGGGDFFQPGMTAPGDSGYQSFAFANARDIEYVKGSVERRLAAEGVTVMKDWHDDGTCYGNVVVLVSEFGIARSGYHLLVYSERKLEARTALAVHFVGNPKFARDREVPKFVDLGGSGCTTSIYEEYVLGLGPINAPEERFSTDRGPIPGTN